MKAMTTEEYMRKYRTYIELLITHPVVTEEGLVEDSSLIAQNEK